MPGYYACGSENKDEHWFTSMRILFGHQSVGNNLVDGLREIPSDVGPIVAIGDGERIPEARCLLAHFRVGTNGNPLAKIDDFARVLKMRLGEGLDFALFKFCYVDVLEADAADSLFRAYEARLTELQNEAAPVTIGHATVPLRARRTGPGAILRTLLGRRDPQIARNAARHRFNEHLRRRYADTGLLFDLATIEANRAGTQPPVRSDAIPALRAEYTSDGGHLNTVGREVVAAAFARYIGALRSRRAAA
jgi:hypothetical protein